MKQHHEKKPELPNRHVMALVTFLSLLPLVYYIPGWVIENVTDHRLGSTVLAVALIVPVISYGVMPAFIKTYSHFKRQQ